MKRARPFFRSDRSAGGERTRVPGCPFTGPEASRKRARRFAGRRLIIVPRTAGDRSGPGNDNGATTSRFVAGPIVSSTRRGIRGLIIRAGATIDGVLIRG